MAYLFLACAILFEVLGTIAMKYSEGFTKVIPSLVVLVSHGICFVSLAIALKSLPMSMVYAVWAGVGTALMVIFGRLFFAEPVTSMKAMATVLIIAGVVMLNFGEDTWKSLAEPASKTANPLAPEANVVPVNEKLNTNTVQAFDTPPRVVETRPAEKTAG